MNKVTMNVETFWNRIYAEHPARFPDENQPVLRAALDHFGDISGKRLLDVGCGNGSSSLFFARQGAEVVSIDLSAVAIQGLTQFCQAHDIRNIAPLQCSAFEISNLPPFDFVFGEMILHHLEPFDQFAALLRNQIVPGGKAFFYENSAVSNVLVWFRNNLVGKYGIPKYGDEDEFPLTPAEVTHLKHHFAVEVVYPELLFFRLASWYLLAGKLEPLMKTLDQFFYQFSSCRRLSYRQYLLMS
jgi:SAM-dependent methyltransferase